MPIEEKASASDLQMYQLPTRTTLQLSDIAAVDDDTSLHETWKYTLSQLLSQIVNIYTQLASTSQVDGLDGALTALQNAIDAIDLQDAFDNGNGSINTESNKPFTITETGSNFNQFSVKAIDRAHLNFSASGSPTNEKNWTFSAMSDGTLQLSARSDDLSTGSSVLEISRTGTSVDLINFTDGELQYGGEEVAIVSDIIISSWDGSTTPVAVTAGSGISITSGVISADSLPSSGAYTLTVDVANTSGAGSITPLYSRYIRVDSTIIVSARFSFVPSAIAPVIAFSALFTGAFSSINQGGGNGTLLLESSPTGSDGSIVASTIPSASSIAFYAITPAFDGSSVYVASVNFCYEIQ